MKALDDIINVVMWIGELGEMVYNTHHPDASCLLLPPELPQVLSIQSQTIISLENINQMDWILHLRVVG